MDFNATTFTSTFIEEIKNSDDRNAPVIVDNLIDTIYKNPGVLPVDAGEKILAQLRNKRMFYLIQKVTEVFIQTGLESFKIRRLYARSIIETGNFTSAISIVNSLLADIKAAIKKSPEKKDIQREHTEVYSLLGMTYKKMYLAARNQKNSQGNTFLNLSISVYYSIYVKDPANYLWHGINAVGLLYCAEIDKIKMSGYPSFPKLAADILAEVKDKQITKSISPWDHAVAIEACIALERLNEAMKWADTYVRFPEVDAFELESTITQIEKIWLIAINSDEGKLLMTLLRAELLNRKGGNLLIDVKDLPGKQKDTGLQKVFGNDSFKTLQWYSMGIERAHLVGRIGKDASHGFGTGFLLPGSLLHEELGDELYLLTCSHIISDDNDANALKPYEAKVVFESLKADEEFYLTEIIWCSSVRKLDASIVQFDQKSSTRLKELTKDKKFYPIAPSMPATDQASRVYIIGYPHGGTLQISLQDNLLLDHDDTFIHYRTPTVGGSGGSPVFNEFWDLIGIHHAGGIEMKMLNGRTGTYEANEGVAINAIKQSLETGFAGDAAEKHDTAAYLMKKGGKLELARKYDEALKVYLEGCEKFPEEYEFLKKVADAYKGKSDLNQYLASLIRYNERKNRHTLENNLKKNLFVNQFSTNNHPFYGNLTWPLNRQMNILLGKNGYGKSHLLSIMLALLQNDIQKTVDFSPSGSGLSVCVYEDEPIPAKTVKKKQKESNPDNTDDLQKSISFSDMGLDSSMGKIPVLAISDSRFIDKSADYVSRSKETIDILHDSAFHFIYQKPYAGIIENALYRICQLYSEQPGTRKTTSLKIIEQVIYRLTGGSFNIRDIESMPSTEYRIWVDTEGAEKIPIQKVSQGTFSIISIVLTIYNYLRARYPDVSDQAVLRQNGIVFIDEIDAHLHPSWQQKIVNILRETFPAVQFFITGHSPLIVAGCKTGEVAVLRKANVGFVLDFFEHDFVGYQAGELYKQVFEIESYDETYLKYNLLLPFKKEYEEEIRHLRKKKQRNKEQEKRLEELYGDVYYMNVVEKRKNEMKDRNKKKR